MADLTSALTANRVAVEDLIAAAERSATVWTTPRAPGKWSPSQVVEHVARSLEESANVAGGRPSKFPTLPAIMRPLTRYFFNRVLKKSAFPRAKTNSAMNPAHGPASPQEARVRLEGALTQFETDCNALGARGGPLESTVFGRIPLIDYIRFQELHTRHHMKQIPAVTEAGGTRAPGGG